MRFLFFAAVLVASPYASVAAVAPADIEAPVPATHVDCTIVIDISGEVAAYRPNTFARASITTLRQWKIDPATLVDPLPGGSFGELIPVTWRIDRPRDEARESKRGAWTLETRTVRRSPRWVPHVGHAPQPGVADLAGGEIGRVNHRFPPATPLPGAAS